LINYSAWNVFVFIMIKKYLCLGRIIISKGNRFVVGLLWDLQSTNYVLISNVINFRLSHHVYGFLRGLFLLHDIDRWAVMQDGKLPCPNSIRQLHCVCWTLGHSIQFAK